ACAKQWSGACEVDEIANQHRRAGRPFPVEATAPVGQYEDASTSSNGGPHSMSDLVHSRAFIKVGAAGEDRRDLARRGRCDAECGPVADHRRLRKAGQLSQLATA